MIARDASCRCWAIESATSFRAAILSAAVVRTVVVRGGIPSRGLGVKGMSSALDVMVASDEGNKGGRVCDDEGSRSGVEVVEFSVDGGSTRLALRKEKKAIV
jgi:hypothetical protein